jgi:hypothetical protein
MGESMNRTITDEARQQEDVGNGVGLHERMGRDPGGAFDVARLRELGRNLGGQFEEQARKRPYAMLSAAAGVGFVAGSLLGSRLGQIVLAAGVGSVARNVLGGELGQELLRQAIDKIAPERA